MHRETYCRMNRHNRGPFGARKAGTSIEPKTQHIRVDVPHAKLGGWSGLRKSTARDVRYESA